MRILFLDDDEERHTAIGSALPGHDVFHAYDVYGFVRLLTTGMEFGLVCLDHDLGGMFDGRDATEEYILHGLRCPVWIHSLNLPRAKEMHRMLRDRASTVEVHRQQFDPEVARTVACKFLGHV